MRRDTIAPLGRVRTGIAVADGESFPAIADAGELRASLRAATAIFFPDPERATAGIHFVNVLRTLGVYDEVTPRLRPHQMAPRRCARFRTPINLARSVARKSPKFSTRRVSRWSVRCREFELATVYAAAVAISARRPSDARQFVEWLTGPRSLALRRAGGFEA